MCDTKLGCVYTDVVCNASRNNCTTTVCVAFVGCDQRAKVCNNSATGDKDCTITFCEEDTGKCRDKVAECVQISTAVVIGATLAAGAIAGIVIAIIICLAGAGGGAYAAAMKFNGGQIAAVYNNPTYVGSNNSGTNPLNRAEYS